MSLEFSRMRRHCVYEQVNPCSMVGSLPWKRIEVQHNSKRSIDHKPAILYIDTQISLKRSNRWVFMCIVNLSISLCKPCHGISEVGSRILEDYFAWKKPKQLHALGDLDIDRSTQQTISFSIWEPSRDRPKGDSTNRQGHSELFVGS